MGLNLEEQKAVDRFRKAVAEPSQTQLVIVDFWAEWCGPCKALAPVLEKVAAEYAGKGVVLAKINVDEERFIAAQFQVQSIPTVYAVFQGQPVADLSPMRSESQLKEALDQLLAQLPVQGGAPAEEEAPAEPEQPEAVTDEAAPEPVVEPAVDLGQLTALRQASEADPADMAAQLAYAEAAFAAHDRDMAADTLLAAIGRDPEWNEGAARASLLAIFEAVGLEDPWVAAQRRRLSLLLFG